MIKFWPLQFEIKLVIKLNYNLYIHVKFLYFLEFINQVTPPKCKKFKYLGGV